MNLISLTKLFTHKKKIIFFFLILNILFKLPSFFNSVDPFVFIDEFILWVEFERLIIQKTLIIEFFRVGGSLNYYPSLFFLLPLSIFDISFKLTPVLVFSRLLMNILASSISIIYLIKINNEINPVKTKYSNFLLSAIFVLNPYLLGQTNQWYPDSYLYLFSILVVYYLILIYNGIDYKKNTYKLFLSIALGVSVKITFFYLGAFVFIFFLNEIIRKKNLVIFLLIKGFTLFFSIFFLLNISSLFRQKEFLNDFKFLISHYGERSLVNLDLVFPFYANYLFIVPIGIFGFIFLIYNLYSTLKEKNYLMIILFYLLPFSYVLLLSFYPVFLNRNINLFVPLILLSTSIGVERFIVKSKDIKKNPTFIFFTLFLLTYLISFSVTLTDDFKTDSRLQAYEWILDNELLTYSFNTNDHHIAQGLKEIDDRIKIYHGTDNLEQYDFYIVNGWNKNELIDINFPNILFVQNHTNDHYRYMGNKNYFNNFFVMQEKITTKDFIIVSEFKGNGPPIYLFKKLESS